MTQRTVHDSADRAELNFAAELNTAASQEPSLVMDTADHGVVDHRQLIISQIIISYLIISQLIIRQIIMEQTIQHLLSIDR